MITQETLEERNIYIETEYVDSTIASCTKRIVEEINKRSLKRLDTDKLSDYQKKVFEDAIIDLIEYQDNTGNSYKYNGINADGQQLALCPKYIIDNLRTGGLIR